MKLTVSQQDAKFLKCDEFDTERIKEIKDKILDENKVMPFLYGFTYNNITEIVVEITPKYIQDYEIQEVEKDINYNDIIIGKPTEEFLLLSKLYMNTYSMEIPGFIYLSIRKEHITTNLEKMNLLLFLLSKINKGKYSISDLYINRILYDTIEENDVSSFPPLTDDLSLKINDEDMFQDALYSELLIGNDKYLALYKIIEGICVKNKITLDKLGEKQSSEMKNKIEEYRKKVSLIIDDDENFRKYEGIKIFKYVRNYLAHGGNFELEKKLEIIIDEASDLLKNIITGNT